MSFFSDLISSKLFHSAISNLIKSVASPLVIFLYSGASFATAEIVLTFGGDFNLNANRQQPLNDRAIKHGRAYSFSQLFDGVRPLLNGELNIVNLESVVSDQRNLPDRGGAFLFVTHPVGVEEAFRAGINVFALANNHTADHGPEGMLETIQHMGRLSRQLPLFHHGLGVARSEVLRPLVIPVQTPTRRYSIAFFSMTGLSNHFSQAGPTRAGTLYFRDLTDFRDAMRAMREVQADFKILSVHFGREGVVQLDPGQRELFHRAMREGDLDLILGHHPHVARPVERLGNKFIFYSLGNFLMLGAADINRSAPIQSFGLFGRLYLNWNEERRRLEAQASEVIPLVDTHLIARPYPVIESEQRLALLNRLSEQQLGAQAVLWSSLGDGVGFHCFGRELGPRAREVCRAGASVP